MNFFSRIISGLVGPTDLDNIKSWLAEDPKGNWQQHPNNPSCFTDIKIGRVLYVYTSQIRFWEDTRVHEAWSNHKHPTTKQELFNIIGA